MTDSYRLAERIVRITTEHTYVHKMCREYRCEGAPDILVECGAESLVLERERSAQEARSEGRPVGAYSDAYLESLAVYRQIAEKMPFFDTFLFHGSAVAVDGAAYLFTARSGVGKSTHTRLWRELLGERAVMVNDDKPLIRVTEDAALVYGTPWDGKHHLSRNICVPLRAVCHLERGTENRIIPITGREALPILLQQSYRPADSAALLQTIKLLDRLMGQVKFYRLSCNMEPEAAKLSFEAMG